MSRVQLSLNVADFDGAVAFYSRLFGTRAWEYYTVLEQIETP